MKRDGQGKQEQELFHKKGEEDEEEEVEGEEDEEEAPERGVL